MLTKKQKLDNAFNKFIDACDTVQEDIDELISDGRRSKTKVSKSVCQLKATLKEVERILKIF